MRKMVCILLAVTMLCAVPMGISAATATTHEVYNLTFDGGMSTELDFGAGSEYLSGGSLKMKADASGAVTKLNLARLDKKSDTAISVDVAAASADSGTRFQLIAYLTQGTKVSEYVLDTANTIGGAWTTLSGRISTRLISVSKIEIGVSAVSGGTQTDYLLDNFKVTSSKPRAEAKPVTELKNDGKLMLRGSFETGKLERWYLYRGATYECTDETLPHSGQYVLKVDDRENNGTTLICNLNNDDLDPNMVLNVSCWVKKLPQDESTRICIQQKVAANDGNKWKYHNWITITDDEWHELTATIDLSQFSLKRGDQITLYVSTGDSVFPGFYADDMRVYGDKPGEFWDDMAADEEERDPALSDTAYQINGFYKPIQEDIPALKDVYKDYFKIGGAGWPQMLNNKGDDRFAQLFLKHFNSYVDNGAFKSTDLLNKKKRNRTEYNFAVADQMMDFAYQNQSEIDEVIGHVLVWIGPHKDYEVLTKEDGTFLTRDEALSFMKENITKIIKHFEGDGDPSEYTTGVDYSDWHIPLWDVVNEAIYTNGTMKSYAGKACWYNVVGEEYINYAFDYADEVCKTNGYDIKLRYNDYAELAQPQIDRAYQLVRDLLADGCRVDSVGMQCHFYADYDIGLLRDYVEKIASLNVHIDGTELDFGAYTTGEAANRTKTFDKGITKERENTQAILALETMQIFKEYHEIVDRVVFWTYYDGVDWWDTRDYDHVDYAGLFDRNYQAKPMYWAVADPEYFVKNYLNEDTSKVRLSLNGITLKTEEDDILEQDGIVYAAADVFLDGTGISYVENNQVYSMILDGSYIELKEGTEQIVSFAPYTLKTAVLMHNDKLYLPVLELCELFDFSTNYNDLRNMIHISIGEKYMGDAY